MDSENGFTVQQFQMQQHIASQEMRHVYLSQSQSFLKLIIKLGIMKAGNKKREDSGKQGIRKARIQENR